MRRFVWNGVFGLVAVVVGAAGCGAGSLQPGMDAGPGGNRGTGGAAPADPASPAVCVGDLARECDVLSDFEIQPYARVNMQGTPPRSGLWYTYNDGSATCAQDPAAGELMWTRPPLTPSPLGGGNALHVSWSGCNIWGAGIGAHINEVEPSDGAARYPQPYDLSGYRGLTFWGMTSPGVSARLRVKLVMRAETLNSEGGACDEQVVGVNKCRDSWGQTFTLPVDGRWQQVTVLFSDTSRFKQEAWGALFPWNPADVIGIEIQSQGNEIDQPFDFWIDDVLLVR